MAFLPSLDISASGLTAERLRMDVIANNLANAWSTRSARGGPYRRQMPVFASREASWPWAVAAGLPAAAVAGASVAGFTRSPATPGGALPAPGGGVEVVAIVEDPGPPRLVYDPEHPDARPDGYVEYPNVDVVSEMVDLLAASRAYQANLSCLAISRDMARQALEIIRV